MNPPGPRDTASTAAVRRSSTLTRLGLRGLAGNRLVLRAFALFLALIVAVTVGWLIGRSAGSHAAHTGARSQPQEWTPPSQDEISSVMRLLQGHARAMLARDQQGFDGALDQADPASSYRAVEQASFRDLAGVPLTTWRYTLTAPVTDASVLQPAATRLDGRVVILHVQLQYGFAEVDRRPTAKDEWLTAVHRAAGWRLASDSDAASVGGESWRGPWAYGPLIARRGPHTLVLVHPDHASAAATFAMLVERSIPVVSSVWGAGWNDQVAILIPDSTAEFQMVSGTGGNSSDIAAVAVADQVDPEPGLDPRDAVLGARIVINPDNLAKLDAAGRQLVVQHELTHIATRADTDDHMPSWLIEGFADYVGNLNSGRPPAVIAQELAAELRKHEVPVELPSSTDFDGGNPRLSQVYEEAWLACRLIAQRIGQHGLVTFYRTVAAAARRDPTTSAAVGLHDLLHTDVADFTASWRQYLMSQLG